MEAMVLAGSFAAWAIVHSWLASQGAKNLARRMFGAGGYRGYRLFYNVFSLLSLAPIALLARRLPDRVLYAVDAPWSHLMLGAQLAAAICLGLAFLQTGPLSFAGIAQLFRQDHEGGLVTTGFYALVRHPLYLFGMLFLWLAPSMSPSQFGMTVVATIYFFVGATLEERRLLQEFGDAYDRYRTTTPMIVPLRVGRYRGA